MDNLDWERLPHELGVRTGRGFPFYGYARSRDGASGVEARWRQFFEEVRAPSAGPPYLHLKPRDLRVDRYGDVGLVTFMFEGTARASIRNDIRKLLASKPDGAQLILAGERIGTQFDEGIDKAWRDEGRACGGDGCGS